MISSSNENPTSNTRSVKKWLFALLLLSPIILLYASHYFNTKGIPTGFIQNDLPYYMANGREAFDGDSFSLFYSNPYSFDYNSPEIFFQPHLFILGLLAWLTNLEPGFILCLFGLIASFLCIRVLIAVFEELFGLDTYLKWLGAAIVCWGGGIHFLVGFSYTFLKEFSLTEGIKKAFRFDVEGWAATTLGRNFIYPTEAYYHLIALLIIWSIIKRKDTLTCLLLAVISMSHPFTGIQMILIVLTWQMFERFYLSNKSIKLNYIFMNWLFLVVHFSYYLVFLTRFPEQASLTKQWIEYSSEMMSQAINFVPTLILVALLFFYQIRTPQLFVNFFQIQINRFLMIFALVTFVLSNHEFAINPMQPLHFDRGYIWLPLCLLGIPALLELFKYLLSKPFLIKFALISFLAVIFLADNLVWFPTQYNNFYKGNGFVLTKDEKDIIDFIKQNGFDRHTLLVSNEEKIGYLIATYTPLRTFLGHFANTPNVTEVRKMKDDFFMTGTIPDKIVNDQILILVNKTMESRGLENVPKEKLFENDSFIIYKK
jgi:hypothetical protein